MKNLRRAARLAREAASHASKGFPRCSQEQVDSRFKLCSGCEYYEGDEEKGVCSLCECNCNKEVKFLNKLAWKDQVCPILKWDEIDE